MQHSIVSQGLQAGRSQSCASSNALQEEEEENKKARRKRDKLKSALTRPLGPADPQHKGTSLHLRLTYRECSEEQVRASQQRAPQSQCQGIVHLIQVLRALHAQCPGAAGWWPVAQRMADAV
jgi:hypothetical protein